MARKWKLLQWLLIGTLLVTACTPTRNAATTSKGDPASTTSASTSISTARATPTTDPEAEKVIQNAIKLCSGIQAGQVCLGEGPVLVEAQPGRKLKAFQKPGQILNLADIQRLKLGEAASGKGLALLRILTENPGEAFNVVAFGDVELVNQVPYGTMEFNGMQSIQLSTGAGEEDGMPTSGLLVHAPGEGKLSTLVVNGAEMTFGSTALLTSVAGGMTVQTMAGAVGISSPFSLIGLAIQGTVFRVTREQLIQGLTTRHEFTPQEDDEFHARMIQESLDRYFSTQKDGTETNTNTTSAHFSQRDWPRINRYLRLLGLQYGEPKPYEDPQIRSVLEALKRAFEKRRQQKPWKGGWWKMTPAGMTVSGKCQNQALGVHQCGGCDCGFICGDGGKQDKSPNIEIPICRGNNGNTILMYESGTSYDKIGPNMFAKSSIEEMNFLGGPNYITTGSLQTLQVVGPTRMILNQSTSEGGGCNVSTTIVLDFVRDDPAVRCGKIIDIPLSSTPVPVQPTSEPQSVDPPLGGEYPVRVGLVLQACDAEAKPYAPDLSTATIRLSPENKLIIETTSNQFELEQTGVPLSFYSAKTFTSDHRYGIFTLQKTLTDPFNLSMTLTQIPGGQWSGNWLVSNGDASRTCSGSIDILSEKQ